MLDGFKRFGLRFGVIFTSGLILLACNGMTPKGKLTGLTGNSIDPQELLDSQINLFGPPNNTNNDIASFEFSVLVAGNFKFACSLDDANFSDCQSPLSISNLEEGEHTLRVKVLDKSDFAVGFKTHNWTLDMTPPDVSLVGTPPMVTGNNSARFVFETSDGMSGVREILCSLDMDIFTPCTNPVEFNNLTVGMHNLDIKVIDAAGNESEPLSFSWEIDPQASSLNITGVPGLYSNTSMPIFEFSGIINNQPVAVFECQMDSNGFMPCSSPHSYFDLAEGQHTFAVRAQDSNNNFTTPITYSWEIDLTTPSVSIDQGPMGTINNDSATIDFTAMDLESGLAMVECFLNDEELGACSSSLNLTNIGYGENVFRVRATDNAGNVGMAEKNWIYDNRGPKITIAQASLPPSLTNRRMVNFSFAVEDDYSSVQSIECKLDSGPFEDCSSMEYIKGNLIIGQHTFNLRAVDSLGNTSEETYSWTITSGGVPPPPNCKVSVYELDFGSGTHWNHVACDKYYYQAPQVDGVKRIFRAWEGKGGGDQKCNPIKVGQRELNAWRNFNVENNTLEVEVDYRVRTTYTGTDAVNNFCISVLDVATDAVLKSTCRVETGALQQDSGRKSMRAIFSGDIGTTKRYVRVVMGTRDSWVAGYDQMLYLYKVKVTRCMNP